MKAFILAAGLGERLRPLTENIPKPLIPVLGIPSICFAITLLKEAGVSEVVCNLHYRPDDITLFFRRNDNFGLDITFSYEETILGTGGGLKKCVKFLDDDNFIMINSDIVTDIYLAQLVEKYDPSRDAACLALAGAGEGSEPTVSLEGDRVADFKNFLGSGLPPVYDYTGVALLSPEVFSYLDENFSSVVYTAYTELALQRRLSYFRHEGMWLDIGSIGSLRAAEKTLILKGNHLVDRVEKATGFRALTEPLL